MEKLYRKYFHASLIYSDMLLDGVHQATV